MYRIPDINYPFEFTNDFETSAEGLLAIGGNLLPLTLIDAYSKGIFPWFSERDPILWWHPHPRLVLFPKKVHIAKRMRRLYNKSCLIGNSKKVEAEGEKFLYFITINQNFKAVIEACAKKRTKDRTATWITKDMLRSYCELHAMGYAHSVEVWNRKRKLVGGMYGVAMGKIFFGESMFSHEPNASKLALFRLCSVLQKNKFILLDCQVESAHLKTLGAETISRQRFLGYLKTGKTHLKLRAEEFL